MSKFKDFDNFVNETLTESEELEAWCRKSILHNEVENEETWKINANKELAFLSKHGIYEIRDLESRKLPFNKLKDFQYDIGLKVIMPNLKTVKGLGSVDYNFLMITAGLKKFDEVIYANFLSATCKSLVSIENLAASKLTISGQTRSLTSIKDMHEEVTFLLIEDASSLDTLQIGKKVKNFEKLTISNTFSKSFLNSKISKEIEALLDLEVRDDKFKYDTGVIRFERSSSPLCFAWLESNEPLEEWVRNHRGKIASKRFGF